MRKLCLILLFLAGCSSAVKGPLDSWMGRDDKLKVLSTTTQVGDLVAKVGGERVAPWVLIQGDLDPHSYELVKGDGEKFARADQIFYSGLGLEHGASLAKELHGNPKAVGLADEIRTAHPDKILFKGQSVDPHLWMDISLWKEGVPSIVAALSKKDPAGASYYEEQGRLLIAELEEAHLALQAKLRQVPERKRYLVTSHDAFHYFARSYLAEPGEVDWQKRVAAPEGLSPDGQLKAADIQKIVDFIKERDITVIFPETNVSQDSIKKICSVSKGVHICQEPLYGDATSGLTYLEMMQRNGEVLKCNLLLTPTN